MTRLWSCVTHIAYRLRWKRRASNPHLFLRSSRLGPHPSACLSSIHSFQQRLITLNPAVSRIGHKAISFSIANIIEHFIGIGIYLYPMVGMLRVSWAYILSQHKLLFVWVSSRWFSGGLPFTKLGKPSISFRSACRAVSASPAQSTPHAWDESTITNHQCRWWKFYQKTLLAAWMEPIQYCHILSRSRGEVSQFFKLMFVRVICGILRLARFPSERCVPGLVINASHNFLHTQQDVLAGPATFDYRCSHLLPH